MADSLNNGICEDPKNRPLTDAEMQHEDHQIDSDYEVNEERLGRGGCAVVYEGWRKKDDFHVAIKVLALPATADEQEAKVNRKRFYREAKLIASLREEHIVQCVDYGVYERENSSPCMVLEFIKGQELGDYLKGFEYLPINEAVNITVQLLQALAVAHSKTIIHRDIKPGNIMVLEDSPAGKPQIKVLDFGIATVLEATDSTNTLMTQQGNIRGTPPYMAPELFTGAERASIESDLYAVGLVLLECLTNKVAFDGASFMQIAYKHVNEEADIPTYIPECLANVIRKAINKKKADRYHSADEFINDLLAVVDQAVKEHPKCAAIYAKTNGKKRSPGVAQTLKRNKTHILIIAAILVVIALAVTGFVVAIQHQRDAAKAKEDALEAKLMGKVDALAESQKAADVERAKQEADNQKKLDAATKETEQTQRKLGEMVANQVVADVFAAWNAACKDTEAKIKADAPKPAAKPKTPTKQNTETKPKGRKGDGSAKVYNGLTI